MKTSQRIGVVGMLTVCLSACGSNPPKLVLPDGSHRVPVNTPLPTTSPATPSAISPAISPVGSPTMSPTATGAQS